MLGEFDALLVVSFGGPEGPDEVMPFLERVTRGRGVPRERLEEVATHYAHFGGKSPIGERTRELVAALRAELPELPVYLGNRFAAPFLADTVRAMREAGVRRALAFATAALSSWSSCRAYLDDIARAVADAGEGAPVIEKLPPFALHPGYVETCLERLRETLARLPDPSRARVLFTAHSIPVAMARECAYEAQFEELSARVAGALGLERWQRAYQSRSGPPSVPWLEPDVLDALRAVASEEPGATVVVAPIGFVADHMEVVYDLDVEARGEAERLGLTFVRASAANAHPRFVRMVRALIEEHAVRPVRCADACCPPPRRRVP
ncbi:MAG TPA: ferrochelatase [Sandaracinaceae bacterium]